MLLRKVFRDLSQRKLRTILTISGLAIAVFCITGFGIVSASILKSAEVEYGVNSADAYIGLDNVVWNQTLLPKQSNITDCEVTYFHYSTLYFDAKLHNFGLRGIESNRLESLSSLAGVFLVEGELPENGKDEILFDVSCAKALDMKIGDELNYTVINSLGIVEDHKLEIVGLARSLYSASYTFDSDLQAWMDISQIQDLLDKPGEVTGVYLKYSEGTDLVKETEIITEYFKNEGLECHIWTTYTLEDDWRYWLLEIFNLVLLLLSIVGFIIGGVLTANTIHMAIASERKDIALTKVIGGSRKDIMLTYILEALFFGITGAIVGMILSVAGAYFLLKWMMVPFNVSTFVFTVKPLSIILGLIIPIVTSVIFALLPIRSAIKVPPIEALRDKEAKYSTSSKKIRTRLVQLRYSITNLLRKKTRLILNVVMISLAIGLVVSTTSARNSYLKGIDDYFVNQPLDILVDLPGPTNVTEVSSVMDGYISSCYTSDISELHYMRWEGIEFSIDDINMGYMLVIGIQETDPVLEHYNLVEGRYFNTSDINSTNIVLPNLLAKNFNNWGFPLSIGSTIEFHSPYINQTFTVVGIVDDLYDGGYQFYIPMSAMNNLYNCSTKVNVIYVQLEDASLNEEIAARMSRYDQILARGWLVQSSQSMKDLLVQQMNFTIVLFVVIIVMGIVIAIFGGFNTFTMSAMERQKEIALLKLIGSSPRWIISSFLTEGLLAGFLASIFGTFAVGIPLGVLIVSILSDNLLVCSFILSWTDVIIGLAMGGILGLLSAIYPGYKASRTSVVSALQYE